MERCEKSKREKEMSPGKKAQSRLGESKKGKLRLEFPKHHKKQYDEAHTLNVKWEKEKEKQKGKRLANDERIYKPNKMSAQR